MHVDPLYVLVDIGCVHIANTLCHLPNLTTYVPTLYPSYMYPLTHTHPFPFPSLLPPLSVSITHHLSSYPPPHFLSLQGNGSTALMAASEHGHAEAIKLLLAAPDIDVNQAKVSLYLLTPSYLVVGGGFITHLPHPIPPSNPRNDDLSSL